MPEEITEAVQIIRVAYDGIEIAMKVGSDGLEAMKNVIRVLKGMLDYEKTMGKTSMRKLLMRGGDLQVMEFDTNELKKVQRLAKKYGLLYSVMPDINKGKTEIIFHSEATPRANVLVQKLNSARVTNLNDFVKGNDAGSNNKLVDFFEKQKKGNALLHTDEDLTANKMFDDLISQVGQYAVEKENISVENVTDKFSIEKQDAEKVISKLETMGVLAKQDGEDVFHAIMDEESFKKRIRGYQDLADRMKAISMAKHINLSDITLAKTLIAEENARAVKTRVPGTWGQNVRYLWLKKEDIIEIHNGKTMLSFIDREKEYKLYDKENRVVEVIRGEKLYSEHYDKVEAVVRQRAKKMQKEAAVRSTQNKEKVR